MSHILFIKKDELNKRENLKLKRCSHCGMTGTLNLHDYIYGFDEKRDRRILKGRRIFCSNRNRRKGCGKTILYRIADFLSRSLISADIAWIFLLNILSGMSIEKAYGMLDPLCVLSLSTFFRFWKKFKLGQHNIRTFILNNYILSPVPDRSPVLETIRHLETYLPDSSLNPVSNYQKLSESAFV